MKKFTLALCAIVVFTSCTGEQAPQATTSSVREQGKPGIKTSDSPIVVSDGSTHLRHLNNQNSNGDFQAGWTIGSGDITVNDGVTPVNLTCSGNITPSACTATPIPLTAWTLDIFNADNNKIVTLKPDPKNVNIIRVKSHGNAVDPEQDVSGDTTGTDLNVLGGAFASATLQSGGAMTTLTCTKHPCKLFLNFP